MRPLPSIRKSPPKRKADTSQGDPATADVFELAPEHGGIERADLLGSCLSVQRLSGSRPRNRGDSSISRGVRFQSRLDGPPVVGKRLGPRHPIGFSAAHAARRSPWQSAPWQRSSRAGRPNRSGGASARGGAQMVRARAAFPDPTGSKEPESRLSSRCSSRCSDEEHRLFDALQCLARTTVPPDWKAWNEWEEANVGVLSYRACASPKT